MPATGIMNSGAVRMVTASARPTPASNGQRHQGSG